MQVTRWLDGGSEMSSPALDPKTQAHPPAPLLWARAGQAESCLPRPPAHATAASDEPVLPPPCHRLSLQFHIQETPKIMGTCSSAAAPAQVTLLHHVVRLPWGKGTTWTDTLAAAL